ncbi:autotransporter domain-containing protein [Brucella thiophenivorans]|uniref:Outer membrane autotransporter barrel domain protein n=1 Tax=Brucella thiophenivorans TaxID=571255 RepID=A0A256G0Z1_9HYPH|nr:autotransporter domain-containing protein [Brucella thiophenivorans]OYR20775.1 outer membrane autotransporter barrel domain protein [Brucella thiophenivorans]
MLLGTTKRNRKLLALTAQLLCGVAGAGIAATPAGAAESYDIRVMTLNIWNKFKQNPELTADFMKAANFDVLGMQEINGSTYVTRIPDFLQTAGRGSYGNVQIGDVGIISRLPGTFGTLNLGGSTQGRFVSYTQLDAQGSRPKTLIGTVHLDYADGSTGRLSEAKALNTWAKGSTQPIIVMGDFNAGDVSERGLHHIDAQIRLMQQSDGNNFYRDLTRQYILNANQPTMRAVIQEAYAGQNIDNLTWKQWGDALSAAYKAGKDVGLAEETYAVDNNLPVTMNVLKKQYMLLQTDAVREGFKPHDLNDGSTTWPSAGEDATNTWASWDRAKIDHFLVSRPFGKWYEIVDDPADPYTGVIKDVKVTRPGRQPEAISDHEPVAHDFRWVGPQLDTYSENQVQKTRLVWGTNAYGFADKNKEFVLTRNNHRTDLYLGQISDANGKPVLNNLTLEEKKTLLNCDSTDARFEQAIEDYCIDDHSFIGETAVTDGGTILVSEDAALGNANARLRLIGGGLRITGSDMKTLDRTVSLEGLGWIDIANANSRVTLLQQATGEGALLKRGAGTLILGQSNNYTGGTLVEGGVLQAGADGAFVNNTAFAVNGGKLDLNNFNVSMSSLMGEGGILSLGSADLTINQSANTRFDGNIDGTGSLTKSGTGILVLNGSNNYTGGTTVKEGGLVIGDASHSGAFLGGVVSVENGAHLGGAGFIGGLYAGAGSIIAPGNSIGTLKVAGDLTFDAAATYVAEIDASGKSDRIDVSGTATLGGAKVYIEKAAGTYMPGKRYTLLSAEGGITGSFGDLSQNMPFVDLGLAYDANNVYLDLARNDVDFVSTAKTGNQRSVALAVEALGAGNAVYDTVVMQDSEDNVRRAFNALSGEIHASTKTAIINDSSIVRDAVMDRIGAAFVGAGQSAASSSVATDKASAQVSVARAAIWGQALGQWSETRADGSVGKLKQSTGGFVAGYDAEVVENWRLGALAGYSRTSFDVNARSSSGHSDNYHLGIYGGTQWDATLLKAGLAYSWHKIETDHFVAFPGFSENLDANYSANSFQAFGELSHRFDLNETVIEPFANVAVVRLQTDRFNENGGNAALQIGKETTTTTFTTLGLRASAPVVFGSMNAKLNGTVGWQHAYGDTIPTTAAAFDDGMVFEVAGAPISKDTAIIKAGFDINLGNQTTLGLEYSGQYGSNFNQNSGKAKLSVKF